MSIDWGKLYASRLSGMTTSIIRDILRTAQAPDAISMSGGWPDAALFPTERMAIVTEEALRHRPQMALQYGPTQGLADLRALLAERMRAKGIACAPEDIVVTSGSQQALDLLGRILLDRGDRVLVENPTFIGALQSFRAYGPVFTGVPMDDQGIRPDALADAVRSVPGKLAYLIPTYQNPTGATQPAIRRAQVLDILDRVRIPIVEDDPYGELAYEGGTATPMAAMARDRTSVVYLGTFSKVLAPGLRLAWAVCPPGVADQLVMAKQGADLHTSTLSQAIAIGFMERDWLDGQIAHIRATYRQRRDAMVAALRQELPPEATFAVPSGGLFLWLKLPETVDTTRLLVRAVQHKVTFVPGAPFHVDGGGSSCLRLTFATLSPERIGEGVHALAEVIREALQVG
jgi:2-aminoadipate transaminase